MEKDITPLFSLRDFTWHYELQQSTYPTPMKHFVQKTRKFKKQNISGGEGGEGSGGGGGGGGGEGNRV